MSDPQPSSAPVRSGKHVVQLGLGAIGAPLCDMLARTVAIDHLTLVDHDTYEESNLSGQLGVRPGDVGRPKAIVQAEKAAGLRPGLRVDAIHAALEDVPLGRLRGDVLVTALHSKRSRQYVSQATWRMGIAWLDAGVRAQDSLARVSVFLPGPAQPCFECAWDDKDYQSLEVKRPCGTEVAERTGAPPFLGALAAALLMAECEKLLAGDWPSLAAGKQITIAAGSHKLYETNFRRFPRCRFDHVTCRSHSLRWDPRSATLGALIDDLKRELGGGEPVRFHLEGKRFVRELRCACGAEQKVFRLEGRMTSADQSCGRCGAPMAPVGFSMLPSLGEESLTAEDRGRGLCSLGLENGDWLMVRGRDGLDAFELRMD